MNLPNVLSSMIRAQDNFNSQALADCFSPDAVVADEGQSHKGRKEIEQWNKNTNNAYKTKLHPISYKEQDSAGILTTKVSGTFDGSPITVKYHFTFSDGLIQSLKITG